ncbi:GAF domain-containing protein [Arthrobacter sp. S39]|uniref:GAF domain-containing protein n=1 Tax=Arthrobacter sp. S39 TaxID=2509720 RepID=UPI001037603D|nr:GAF domain-containing protein [Arthrobacter sp. S39]TAP43374.1 GAF domain-containing protein [Arthrobacter sp. S39]
MAHTKHDDVFRRTFDALAADPGVVLFTALQWIPETSTLRRIFTSHPDEYPVGAEKTVEISAGWLDAVIAEKKPFLAADLKALREVFTDVELIRSLGCGAVINLPVLNNGAIVGVLALLDAEGTYTAQSVSAAAATVEADSAALAEAFVSHPNATPRKDRALS